MTTAVAPAPVTVPAPTWLTTGVFARVLQAWLDGKRHVWVEGGTTASKTYSILQALVLIAKHSKTPLLISIVSESMPHLKRGVIRDFQHIMAGDWQDDAWNKTDSVYTYPVSKSQIEFLGADSPDKLRGPRRDILFINEANNNAYDIFLQLDGRTRLLSICDWNPTAEFWYHLQYLKQPERTLPDTDAYIHATYKDALNVAPPEIIKNIIALGEVDANYKRVYLEGLIGKLDHLVIPRFDVVDVLPKEYQAWGYGLDFGYSNPTALLKVMLADGRLWVHEEIYEAKLTNADLIERLTHMEPASIFADSAEPQRIEEINRALSHRGFYCYPANKDVKFGLDLLKRSVPQVTRSSTNTIREFRGYQHKKGPDGQYLEEPVKINDHACDATRYGAAGLSQRVGLATAAGVDDGPTVTDVRPSAARRW